jgi:hypothetical protein
MRFFSKVTLLEAYKQTNTLSPSPKGFQSPKISDSDSDVRKALTKGTKGTEGTESTEATRAKELKALKLTEGIDAH